LEISLIQSPLFPQYILKVNVCATYFQKERIKNKKVIGYLLFSNRKIDIIKIEKNGGAE